MMIRERYDAAVSAAMRHGIKTEEICKSLTCSPEFADDLFRLENPELEDALQIEVVLVWVLCGRRRVAMGKPSGID